MYNDGSIRISIPLSSLTRFARTGEIAPLSVGQLEHLSSLARLSSSRLVSRSCRRQLDHLPNAERMFLHDFIFSSTFVRRCMCNRHIRADRARASRRFRADADV
jgi:hypothetical protein